MAYTRALYVEASFPPRDMIYRLYPSRGAENNLLTIIDINDTVGIEYTVIC